MKFSKPIPTIVRRQAVQIPPIKLINDPNDREERSEATENYNIYVWRFVR